jgi:MFS family permease
MLAYFGYLESALGPLMSFLGADLHFSYSLVGLHFSAFAIGTILAGLISARLMRSAGTRVTFWGGGAGMGLGALALVIGRSSVLTLAGVAVMGLLGTLLLVTLQAVLSDHHGSRRAIALAEANIGASIGGAVAALGLGLWQQSGLGWRVAIVLVLLIPAVAAWRFHALPLGTRQDEPAVQESRGRRLPPMFWLYWGIIFFLGGAEWCLVYWGAEYLHSPIGFDRSVAAALMSAFLLTMVVGRALGSRLVRLVTSAFLLVLATTVALAGFLLFWLVPWAPLALVGLCVTGLGVANLYPLSMATALTTAPDNSGAASARVSLSSGIALFIAPLTVGGIADRVGLRIAYGIVPALLSIALVGIVLSFVVQRQPSLAAASSR